MLTLIIAKVSLQLSQGRCWAWFLLRGALADLAITSNEPHTLLDFYLSPIHTIVARAFKLASLIPSWKEMHQVVLRASQTIDSPTSQFEWVSSILWLFLVFPCCFHLLFLFFFTFPSIELIIIKSTWILMIQIVVLLESLVYKCYRIPKCVSSIIFAFFYHSLHFNHWISCLFLDSFSVWSSLHAIQKIYFLLAV